MELTRVERAAQEAARGRDAGLRPDERRRSGIVHTAPELARFTARAADDLLREELGVAHGLADARVALVDPACGPGAFLAAALGVAADRPSAPAAVVGMDRDAAAIAAAEHALAPELARAGWPCTLSRCDTLADARPEALARLAPVPVVLGNPPWIGSAQDRPAPWLDALLEDFRRDADGQRLSERKLGVLADAYVRFMRWACEVARCAERGAVLAFVTNASYLDGAVHRGMRALLRRSFDALHVLDLGGNALLAHARERGERDENVFAVRPGVAVLLAVRKPGAAARALPGPVRYQRLYGARGDKLEQLSVSRVGDRGFRVLQVAAGHERFVPTARTRDDYARWPSLALALPFHREGVQTNRDAAVVDRDRARLLERVRAFAEGRAQPELAPALTRRRHYEPELARAAVAAALARSPDGEGVLRQLAYRPLDVRWFASVPPLCHRPRPLLLAAMQRSSFALISVRKDRGGAGWAHFGAARHAIDNCWLSTRSSCRARAFPTRDPDGRDNLEPALAAELAVLAGRAVTAEDFACYALAVLASPAYRRRHEGALTVEYPRIPPPRSAASFEALRCAGSELVALLCDPLPPCAAFGEARAREPLVLDEARGVVRAGQRIACEPGAELLAFTLGHHRVLRELLRAAVAAGADDEALRAACDRVAALARCVAALDAG